MDAERAKKPKLFKADSDVIAPLNECNFDRETFESADPVMVMFGAERCLQCKELFPLVEQAAVQHSDKLKVFWVEADSNESLIQRLRIRGIPNLVIFKNGAIVKKLGGSRTEEEIDEFIQKCV